MRTTTALLLAATAALSAVTTALAGLADDVRAAIRNAGLGDARISVSVRECDSDMLLVSVEGGRAMIPASNMKVLSSGAALHVLGPDFFFRTTFIHDGERFWVVGDGDPAFGDPALLELMSVRDETGATRQGMDVEELLALWVNAARAAGIERVDELVVDDRIFAREFVHPTWPVEQLNTRSFAEVAGLNFHTNVLHFRPRTTGQQRPDVSDMRPRAPWVQVVNKATVKTGPKDRQTVWLTRSPDTNTFTVFGNLKYTPSEPVPVTLHDPPDFFGRLLADRLGEAGVVVPTTRLANAADPTAEGRVIGPIVQTPIATVVTRCNTDSQNLYAEALLKRTAQALTGQPGSWLTGAGAIRHVVQERVGDELSAGLVVADGSGLSRENRVTADLVTAWLDSFHRDATAAARVGATREEIAHAATRRRIGELFIESLAIGGETGTVRSRFNGINGQGVRVQCKTGYINGVSCLSGYVSASDGRRRSFSILCNGLIRADSVSKAKKLQEAIVQLVAEDLMVMSPVLGGE